MERFQPRGATAIVCVRRSPEGISALASGHSLPLALFRIVLPSQVAKRVWLGHFPKFRPSSPDHLPLHPFPLQVAVNWCTCKGVRAHTRAHTHTHTHTHTQVAINWCICKGVRTNSHRHTQAHTQSYIQIDTPAHALTHTSVSATVFTTPISPDS